LSLPLTQGNIAAVTIRPKTRKGNADNRKDRTPIITEIRDNNASNTYRIPPTIWSTPVTGWAEEDPILNFFFFLKK